MSRRGATFAALVAMQALHSLVSQDRQLGFIVINVALLAFGARCLIGMAIHKNVACRNDIESTNKCGLSQKLSPCGPAGGLKARRDWRGQL
jgi:hypothetical protein